MRCSRPIVAAGALLGLLCAAACSADPGPRTGAWPTADSAPPVDSATPAPLDTPLPALHSAVAAGDGAAETLDGVRLLLARGADVTATGGPGRLTAEQYARRLGREPVATLLASATTPPSDSLGRPLDRDGLETLLHEAATRGDADAVSLAVRHGARVDSRDQLGRSALLLAVIDNRMAAARVLVGLGADPDAVDSQRDTPWLVTGVTGSVPMARLIHSAGPDVAATNRFGGISIIPAAERGHVDYLRWTLANTAVQVDHVNDLGWTALLEAVILGDGSDRWQRCVRVLLDAGADPDLADRDGVTPLAHARARGDASIAALLGG